MAVVAAAAVAAAVAVVVAVVVAAAAAVAAVAAAAISVQSHAPVVLTPVGDTQGWFDPSRDGGFIRRAANSYLAEAGDA